MQPRAVSRAAERAGAQVLQPFLIFHQRRVFAGGSVVHYFFLLVLFALRTKKEPTKKVRTRTSFYSDRAHVTACSSGSFRPSAQAAANAPWRQSDPSSPAR